MDYINFSFSDLLDDLRDETEVEIANSLPVYDPTPEDWAEYEDYLNELDKLDTLEREHTFS